MTESNATIIVAAIVGLPGLIAAVVAALGTWRQKQNNVESKAVAEKTQATVAETKNAVDVVHTMVNSNLTELKKDLSALNTLNAGLREELGKLRERVDATALADRLATEKTLALAAAAHPAGPAPTPVVETPKV